MHRSNPLNDSHQYCVTDHELGTWFCETLKEAVQYAADYEGVYEHKCTIWQRMPIQETAPLAEEDIDAHKNQYVDPSVTPLHDPVNHPKHYTAHPSGVECIQITEHMSFCCGNAVKYIWRADHKAATIQDLQKAIWYLQREIERIKKHSTEA